MHSDWAGVIEEFREFLPVTGKTPALTLLEGNTPLVSAPRLSKRIGAHVYLKLEGTNPTGSFKDRGMVLAVAKALEEGKTSVICASTGNTSASAAAYAARAGMKCFVIIPSGNVALGKLSQALIHGAKVVPIHGNFDEALALVRNLAKTHPVALVNSVNPYRIEGQKTAAFEICETLRKAPDYLALPVGNAGNITAYWKGFKEIHARNHTGLPRVLGFQAEGAAPIVLGHPVLEPKTVATAIRIGNPASWEGAKEALAESNGSILALSDHQILDAYRFLAENEGIFAEPASAAPVAGILGVSKTKPFRPTDTIVCVLTGHGLKDPETAMSFFQEDVLKPRNQKEIEDVLFG